MHIKLIYETQVGTTKMVAEAIKQLAESVGHTVDLHSVRTMGRQPVVEGYDLVIFGSPTYSLGNLEPSMARLVAEFSGDLTGKKVAIFALGDHNYEHFCAAADHLEAWVKTKGGEIVTDSLKIDGFPADMTPVKDWVRKLVAA